MILVAIVEDNEDSISGLKNLLKAVQKELNDLIEVETFSNGLDFIESYEPKYDLVFMDIDMPLMNGIEASKKLREKDNDVELIFTTALSQYALFGYDVNASAYLVKPFTEDRKSIERIKKVISRKMEEEKNFYVFTKDKSASKVLYNHITYVESFNHYCVFHTNTGETFRRTCSMKSVEEELSPHGFLRSDNSYLINPLYALKWEKDTIDINGDLIPVSRSRRKEFFEKLTVSIGEKYQ